MDKRTFLKTAGIITVGGLVSPLSACNEAVNNGSETEENSTSTEAETPVSDFELPALPYGQDELVPHIDKMTMEIHHGKHHQGYVNKLNKALDGTAYAGKSLEDIVSTVKAGDTGVRNNGGGHYNHSLFWKVLSPGGGGEPTGALKDAVDAQFGDFNTFSEAFSKAAGTVFGSGWAWLIVADGNLKVTSTPNQDNPLMKNIVQENGTPILGIDVWEHAYYLNYQNERKRYISAFWNIINWNEVASRFDAAKA